MTYHKLTYENEEAYGDEGSIAFVVWLFCRVLIIMHVVT